MTDALIPKDAAGIALMSNGKVLLLKRGDGGDYPGHWCFPGGHSEIGESAEQTALRETLEESGYAVIGSLKQIAYTANGDINFTTFGKNVQEFEPTLSDEHAEAGWFESGKYPEPLHPGCKLILDGPALDAIDIRKMNELDIARAMSAGYVSSPQRYMNVWLFAIRITGTGVAYRKSLEEFVFRNPEMYLNDDFLARCNGLQVIAEHPEKATLNNAEFQDRTIGSIFLPYIQGNEVWGIAKIYDAKAADVMAKFQLSTSPTVVFSNPVANSTITLDDGAALLIEGKPSLLDHVAICIRGVWDKGGPPSGVSTNQLEGNEMTEAELKAKADAEAQEKEAEAKAKAKADSEAAAKADAETARWGKFMDTLDKINKRMDSLESNLPAPTMTAADKAKKDAEEEAKKKADADIEEKKKVAADKAKKDAEEDAKAKADAEETRKRIADLEANLPKRVSDDDYAQMADCQMKADSVYSAFGDSAPSPIRSENLMSYKKRLLHGLKSNSPAWKAVDIYKLDDSVVGIAEAQIYADSIQVANHPIDIAAGTLRKIEKKDENGQLIRTFVGDPEAWMDAFKSPNMKQVGISKGNQ
jgi:8-oxo-dGTP pyrophosphatase MutT (NUDIX family)